jgi:hypothetical protein
MHMQSLRTGRKALHMKPHMFVGKTFLEIPT